MDTSSQSFNSTIGFKDCRAFVRELGFPSLCIVLFLETVHPKVYFMNYQFGALQHTNKGFPLSNQVGKQQNAFLVLYKRCQSFETFLQQTKLFNLFLKLEFPKNLFELFHITPVDILGYGQANAVLHSLNTVYSGWPLKEYPFLQNVNIDIFVFAIKNTLYVIVNKSLTFY